MDPMPTLPPVRLIGFVARQDVRDGEAVGRRIAERLRALAAGGARVLVRCSLAGPADLLCAREAARLGLPLSFLLPAEAGKVWEGLTAAEREEAARLVQEADEAEEFGHARGPESAVLVGARLVQEADDLIAVTRRDGERAAAEMEEIIGYARNRGRPIFLIEEAAGKVEAREVKAGVDEDAARPDDVRLARLFGDAPPAAQVPAELERYFHACDDQAARQAPRVRSYLLNIVLANATASLAGSVSGAFPQTPASGTFLTLIKFTCILAGLIIFGVMRYRQSQGRWLGLRLRAEICRSALATWRCPRLVPFGPAEEVTELRELIQSIRYFRARHRPRREATLEEFKSDYGVRRLGEQYEYFRSQAARAHRVSSRFGPAYWILSSLSLATATGAVIWQSVLHFPLLPGTAVNFFFAFIPAIGPALASWVMAFQAIQSVGRRQGRFGEMQHLTRQAMLDLARCSTWAAALPVVERAEKMLLNEVTEWYLVSKYGK